MRQTKRQSLIEAMTNTGIAFCISLFIAWVVYPLYYPETSFRDTFELTLIFTVISILRGYIIRRFFNRKQITPVKFAQCIHGCTWDKCPECRH